MIPSGRINECKRQEPSADRVSIQRTYRAASHTSFAVSVSQLQAPVIDYTNWVDWIENAYLTIDMRYS